MTGDEMQRAIEFILKNQANYESRFGRIEMQAEETNRQIAQTNQVVEALAETQTEFTQTVLGFITSQNALNDSFQKANDSFQKASDAFQKKNDTFQEKLDALARAHQETEQAIADLTRTVNNFINFSSGNGNSHRE